MKTKFSPEYILKIDDLIDQWSSIAITIGANKHRIEGTEYTVDLSTKAAREYNEEIKKGCKASELRKKYMPMYVLEKLFDDKFKNAKFGDMYETKDGRRAIFTRGAASEGPKPEFYIFYLEDSFCEIDVTPQGDYFDWIDGKVKIQEENYILGRLNTIRNEECED